MAKRGRKAQVHQGDILGLSDADPHVKIPTPIYRDDSKTDGHQTSDPAGSTSVTPDWPPVVEPEHADRKP